MFVFSAIIAEVVKLKRNYKRENVLRSKKSDEMHQTKTKVCAINDHLHGTSLLNYRICVVCKSCFTDKSSIIIDEEDPKYHDIDQNLRRMTKLYVCHECNKFEKKEDDLDNELINRALNQIEFPEGDCRLIPSAELFSINDIGVGEDVWEDREFSSAGKNNIMFPSSAFSGLKDVPISRTESINFLFTGVMPGKSQNAVLQLYSTIFIFAVSKLKPKQYKLS